MNERTYTYNQDNRLVKAVVVQENNILSEEYSYDCEGSRISKTTNEVDVTKYIVDSNTQYANVLAELDGDGNVKCVYTHGDEIISQKRNGTTSFYLFDGHGNTRMLADADGNITDTYDYDAFGNLTNKTGETENSYLYCGEQYDGTTGYYYLRARYMNPEIGRFITMDTYQGTINDPVSLHKYLYAGANSVMNVDPSGNMFFPIVDASVDKIKAAWDKMVVTIGYEQMAKIGIANSIATCLHQNISMMVLGENLLNLIAGKAPNKETKGVFGRGYSISGGLLIGASLQFLFVWDSQLNFGIAVTFNVGGAFGFSVNRDYMYFPTMETIYDLKGSGASAGLGFGIIGGEIEVSGGYIGGTVSIDFGGSFIRGKFFNQFWKDVTEASLGGNFSYTVLIFSYKTFDKK